MHTKFRSDVFGLIAACALLTANSAIAEVDLRVETFKKSLSSVPAPEIPAQAASLVAQSTAAENEATALAVLEAAFELSPATAPQVVGSMSRAIPAVSPAIAAAAVGRQPKLAALIAKAAAVSAPAYAGQIVTAVCRKEPAAYAKVALEVTRALPRAGQSIIQGVLDAIPTLKPFVDWATTMAGKNSSAEPSALLVLTYATALVDKTASKEGLTVANLLAKGLNADATKQLTSTADSSGASTSPDVQGVAEPSKPGLNRSPSIVIVPNRNHDYSRP